MGRQDFGVSLISVCLAMIVDVCLLDLVDKDVLYI